MFKPPETEYLHNLKASPTRHLLTLKQKTEVYYRESGRYPVTKSIPWTPGAVRGHGLPSVVLPKMYPHLIIRKHQTNQNWGTSYKINRPQQKRNKKTGQYYSKASGSKRNTDWGTSQTGEDTTVQCRTLDQKKDLGRNIGEIQIRSADSLIVLYRCYFSCQ